MAKKPEVRTRERMVISTALMVRERGARATSLDNVLAHSGAPRGSIYHHFPGGREQLLREATDYAGEHIAERLKRHSEDPVAAVDWIVREYSKILRDSDFRAGCPVVAVTVESGNDTPDLSSNARQAFERWRIQLADTCHRAGIPPNRSRELALLTIAAIEGAVVLSRAYRNLTPMQTIARELHERFTAELAATSRA